MAVVSCHYSVFACEFGLTVNTHRRDRIGFEIREDGTIVVRAERVEKGDLLSLRGILKPKVRGVTVEEMNETIRKLLT